jgi:hypothetical protein
MKPLPHTPELQAVARRAVWFQPPDEALQDVVRFVAYVLTYGTHSDVSTLRRYISNDELREALDQAPPGIFDPRSWAYWNLKIDRYPAPPMPTRRFT